LAIFCAFRIREWHIQTQVSVTAATAVKCSIHNDGNNVFSSESCRIAMWRQFYIRSTVYEADSYCEHFLKNDLVCTKKLINSAE